MNLIFTKSINIYCYILAIREATLVTLKKCLYPGNILFILLLGSVEVLFFFGFPRLSWEEAKHITREVVQPMQVSFVKI